MVSKQWNRNPDSQGTLHGVANTAKEEKCNMFQRVISVKMVQVFQNLKFSRVNCISGNLANSLIINVGVLALE